MELVTQLFFFLAFVLIFTSLMVVFSKSPIYSVLYLVITMFIIAGHYVLLNAQFLVAVHIIVYAGAVMVLFLFVIMFLNLNTTTEPVKSNMLKLTGIVSGGIFFVVLIASIKSVAITAPTTVNTDIGLIKNIGITLFTEFLLPFEVASILLLAAMVGSVMLGKKEENA